MFILVVFLQLLVLLSVLLYVKEKHSVFAFAAGYYLVFLIQTRPMQLFFIVVVVLLLWAAHKRKEKLFTQSTWIAVALFIVVASLSGLRIYKYYLLQTGSIRPGMYSQKLEYLILKIVGVKNAIYGIPGNAYLDSDYTPVLFIILFITGMVSLSLTNRRLFIFLVLSGFMFAFLYSPVGQHPLNSIRFQNSYQHFFVIISGCGAAWIIQLLHRKKGVALALTITLILAIPLSAYRYRNLIEYKASPQLENEFIREALKDIDDGCYIIQQDQYIEGTNVRTWLPYYYSNYYEKNHIWMEVTDFQSRREEMGENQCILFYRGITCFLYSAHDDIDDSGTERIQCRGMMALNNKKPVAAAIVPSLPDFSQVYKTDYMQIGFFPIEPTRSGKQPDI
ncbi:MAG TPA: hypothetical protein PLN69_09390 [bacterium]|nr:hypothetical protein [bacterium]